MRPQDLTTAKTVAKISGVGSAGGKKSVARGPYRGRLARLPSTASRNSR
jgi:hypothetical protein